MTKQPPDLETLRTERAFQIYLAFLNSPNLDRFFPVDKEENLQEQIDCRDPSYFLYLRKLSYEATDAFMLNDTIKT